MPELFTNNATTTLNAGINNSATSISVPSGKGALFPSPTSPDYAFLTIEEAGVGIEIVKLTARATDTLTIVRAQQGTTGLSFTTAATIELRWTAQGVASATAQRSPEVIPLSPNAADEEFTTPALAGAWTETITPGTGYTGLPSLHGSWFALKRAASGYSGNDTWEIRKALAIGTGAFALTMRGSNVATGNYGETYITLLVGTGATDDIVKIGIAGYNGGYYVGRGDKRISNSWTYGLGSQALEVGEHGAAEWIHVQRDGSNNWHIFWSRNGIGWYRVANWSQSLDVQYLAAGVECGGWVPTQGAVIGGLDFIRRDWLDLL